jgi:hypothetical protein
MSASSAFVLLWSGVGKSETLSTPSKLVETDSARLIATVQKIGKVE